jgi:dUTP pyrophosphatase
MTMRWIDVVTEPGGRAPERKVADAAASDCYVRGSHQILPGDVAKVPLGFRVAIPEGCAGLLLLRSGVALHGMITMPGGFGLIDPGYTGEVCAIVRSTCEEAVRLEPGERIAQLLILPAVVPTFTAVDALAETARGTGGFGSTGTR